MSAGTVVRKIQVGSLAGLRRAPPSSGQPVATE